MKKLSFLIFVISISFLFISCEKPVTTTQTTTVTKVTTSEPGSDGFLISRQLVVKGSTVWGFSRQFYGTGMKWRDIVAQNPFLNEPDRVYYNNDRKMWIVKLHFGEFIRIGNEVISPTVTVEETTTTVEKTVDDSSSSNLIWWGLAGFVALVIIVLVISLINNQRSTAIANSNSEVHVNMRNGCGIDLATENALLVQKQVFWTKALNVADKDSLSCLSIHLDSETFDLKAGFDNKKPEIKNEQKPKEDKKK